MSTRSPMVFTKADQKELRKLRKQEREGKEINWEDVLDKRSEVGRQGWKKYGR